MKAKSMSKRAFALLLTVVMLFSCWVFSLPASADSGGTYYVRVSYQVDNDASGDNHIKLWYTEQNGAENTYTISSCANNGTGAKTTDLQLNGCPYKVEVAVRCSGAWTISNWYLSSITVSANSNYTTNAVTLFSGKMGAKKQNAGWSQTTRTYDFRNDSWSGSWSASSFWSTASTHYAPVPIPKYASSLSFSNVTTPIDSSTVSSTPTVGTVYDQYGVKWYSQDASAVTVYRNETKSGFNVASNSKSITVGKAALATASPWYTTCSAGAYFSGSTLYTGRTSTTALTANVKATNPTYTVSYRWHADYDSSNSWSGGTTQTGVYYNQTPTPPEAATGKTAYFTTDKHYSGGAYSTSAITGDATFDMQYANSANHGNWTYSKIISNGVTDTSVHKATCPCGFSKNVSHDYSGWSSNGDGDNDTHSRTCSQCTFVQTGTHDWGPWSIYTNDNKDVLHYRNCKICDQLQEEDHTDKVTTVKPRCLSNGYKMHVCEVCGNTYQTDIKQALGHSFHYDAAGTAALTAQQRLTKHQEICEFKYDGESDDMKCGATRLVDHRLPAATEVGVFTDEDATNHYRECLDCKEKVREEHNWANTWLNVIPPQSNNAILNHVRAQLLPLIEEGGEYYGKEEDLCFDYCTYCGHVRTAAHKFVKGTTVDPTCMQEGYTPYECSACHYIYNGDYTEPVGHTWGDPIKTFNAQTIDGVTYTSANYHKQVCTKADCDKISPVKYTAHDWVAGEISRPADYPCTKNGTRPYECPTCTATKEETVAPLAHDYTDNTLTDTTTQVVAPTCTVDGQYRPRCTMCHGLSNDDALIFIGSGTATGHNPVLSNSGEGDVETVNGAYVYDGDVASVGQAYVYYKCTNPGCDTCWYATRNTSTGNFTRNESREYENQEALEAKLVNADKVPTPSFNNYQAASYDNYNYAARGASLKLEGSTEFDTVHVTGGKVNLDKSNTTSQSIRFSGCVRIPITPTYATLSTNFKPSQDISKVSNGVIDFGFVYTQIDYVHVNNGIIQMSDLQYVPENQNTEGALGYRIYKMSVVDKNKDAAHINNTMDGTASNWAGVTRFYKTIDGVKNYYLTFNLVVDVKAKNWNKIYVCRPYITYKVNGMTYTVYDSGTTNVGGTTYCSYNSVMAVANAALNDTNLSNPAYGGESDYAMNFLSDKIWSHRSYIPEYTDAADYTHPVNYLTKYEPTA